MNIRSFWKVAGVVVVGAASSVASAELVVNGGFEDGLTGWWSDPSDFGSDFEVIGQGRESGHSLMLSAEPGGIGDVVYQELALVPGQKYAVEFWVLNYGVGNDMLRVLWEGGTLTQFGDPIDFPLESWSFVSLEATATDGPSTLFGFGGYDGNASFLIDDVSVRAVPAPGACVLGALCMAGGLRRRR
ncbi:MAG TPA: hypothetical protein VK176_14940 [Phycisphaerales bacterium]|nr:hypothetical protein [Phycisphaerales bacterium]